jgi:hypothetical protein
MCVRIIGRTPSFMCVRIIGQTPSFMCVRIIGRTPSFMCVRIIGRTPSFMCVRGIDFYLDLRTVPTMWYYCFSRFKNCSDSVVLLFF